MAEKIALALSDGVDSAVAGWLLKQAGYEVHGLYLDIAGEKEKQDAISSAAFLDIPLEIADIRRLRDEQVCEPFARAYRAGRTPNPCIICNPRVKFPMLMDFARRIGAEKIATGHYVRCDGQHLRTGLPEEDQSYMLCRLTREQIRPLILPLGETRKAQARALAAEISLPVAAKPDSRENCFIRGERYEAWLERRGPVPPPGKVFFRGEVIGEHGGIHRYTVGQRWPEDREGRRLYVQALRPGVNEVRLCLWEDLFHTELKVGNLSFLEPIPEGESFRAIIRVRHTRWEMPECTVTVKNELAFVHTDTPLRAPAPGQTAAFYQGDLLLGGGEILPDE